MAFELPKLPYALDALAPKISKETLEYHYGKHHAAYVNKLNELTKDGKFESMSLEEVIMKSSGAIFNNAAQVWNHTFYWNCLTPKSSLKPKGALLEAIEIDFGSFDTFKEHFTKVSLGHFGSGWGWLVKAENDKLELISTANAGNPMTEGKKPLLTCDVWEHAYYIDTRNNRGEYLKNFWELVNWDFVAKNLD